MSDLIVSVPDHCLSFYLAEKEPFLQRLNWYLLQSRTEDVMDWNFGNT